MPVAAQVRFVLRYDDEMAFSRPDIALAPRTGVHLARLIRLDHVDHYWIVGGFDHQPKRAQATTAAVSAMKPTTTNTSTAVLSCWRKGLNPTRGG